MYKVVVNVSGKRAKVVPQTHKLAVFERDFGEISQDEALAGRETLSEDVKGLLADKGIEDADLYTVEVPDALRPLTDREKEAAEEATATADKGPVTKPKNPKKGEKGSDTNQPETQQEPATGEQPSETEPKPL